MTDIELEELKASLAELPPKLGKHARAYFHPDTIRSLIARVEEAEGGWRPIETAPTYDRQSVLIWIGYTPAEQRLAGVPGREEVARRATNGDGWLLDHDCSPEIRGVTHWRPLPPPPSPPES